VNEIRLYHAHRVGVGMADKAIATGVRSGEGSGLNDCRTLKSERKALDKKSGGAIKPPLILFWRRATVNGGDCECRDKPDLLLARKALF
jgi:hypothetical protein